MIRKHEMHNKTMTRYIHMLIQFEGIESDARICKFRMPFQHIRALYFQVIVWFPRALSFSSLHLHVLHIVCIESWTSKQINCDFVNGIYNHILSTFTTVRLVYVTKNQINRIDAFVQFTRVFHLLIVEKIVNLILHKCRWNKF